MVVFTTTAIGSTGRPTALLLGATQQPSSSSSSFSSSSWRFHFALRSESLRFSLGLHSPLNLAPQFLGFRVPFAVIKPSVRGAQTALDKHRENRYDDNNSDGGTHFRRQARSYHPAVTPNYHGRPHGSPLGFRGGRGGRRPFDSSPRHDAGGVRMFGFSGSGGRGGSGDRFYRGEERDFDGAFLDFPPPPPPPQQQFSGQKRGFGLPGRPGGGPPHSSEHPDAANFAKLFVGSVPRNATENDIRPLFEQHGHVIEVAIIRDKRTGQQQGCCFIKFATSDEANRAIRALHNQYTLPGGIGPIQVRYADGERERLGASEYKLFVGSLNKQATEKQVEEIFSPFGLVEDVYLMRDEMKQSRGCGFVKYSQREMALAAIIALNGSYTMRGCDQPLTVRFADPKRPRLGDSRPPPNFSEPTGARTPENAWHPRSGTGMGPSSVSGPRDFSGQLLPKSSDASMPSYPLPRLGITEDRNTPVMSSSVPLQGINQPSPQLPSMQLQISPSQNPFNSTQNFPSSWTLQNEPTTSYSQTLTSYPMSGSMPTPFTQPIPSQPVVGPSGPFSATHTSTQQIATPATAQQRPLSMNLQYQHGSSLASRQQMASPVPQHSAHPFKQSPSPLAQKLSQQTQSLQASLQSSQQVFSQLQQQLQLMQPSSRDSTAPSESPATNLQLNRNMQQSFASSSTDTAGADLPSSAIAPPKCSWTEHTSPDGYQYYYNSVTGESRWVEPDELKIFKLQQQQRHNQVKESVQQSQIQSNPPVFHPHQGPQIEHMQLQTQLQSQLPHESFQQTQLSSELGYAQYLSAANLTPDSTRFQQGVPAAQDWMWKSK